MRQIGLIVALGTAAYSGLLDCNFDAFLGCDLLVWAVKIGQNKTLDRVISPQNRQFRNISIAFTTFVVQLPHIF